MKLRINIRDFIEENTDQGETLLVHATFDVDDLFETNCIPEEHDFDIDIRPSRHMLMMLYPDVPGMVGKFGTVLGGGGVNIARMEVGRDARGRQAIVLVAVDDPVPAKLVEEIRAKIELKDIKAILLPAV